MMKSQILIMCKHNDRSMDGTLVLVEEKPADLFFININEADLEN